MTRRLQCYRSIWACNVSFIKIISVEVQFSCYSPVYPLLCPVFKRLFFTFEIQSGFPDGICEGPKLFFCRNPTVQCCREFCGVPIVAACYDGTALCWWWIQRHLPYISSDAHIYLCRTAVSKVSCHVLVQASHSFISVLDVFLLSIFWYCRAIFHMERAEGVYIYFNEMWPKCLAKCELKFYCKQVTT